MFSAMAARLPLGRNIVSWTASQHRKKVRCLSTVGSDRPFSLPKWHAAVAQVPLSKILPMGFGAESNHANIAAFFGDQRINMAVALTLQQIMNPTSSSFSTSELGLAWLSTNVKNEAISNQMFASHLEYILPVHSQELISMVECQPHDAGTLVEAAVETVASSTPGGTAGKEAVEELAAWLVETALKRGPTNSKGDLLEAGGVVSSMILDGYPAHEPRFVATAQLGDRTCEAEGRSKLKAEHAASAQLFQLLYGRSGKTSFSTMERVQFIDESDSEEDQSDDFIEINVDAVMNIRNGEDKADWWWKGATIPKSAFHRAMMAPHAFPDDVAVVKSWIRQDAASEHYSALIVVMGTSSPQERPEKDPIASRCFLEHGRSKSSARRAVGLSANHFIASEILGKNLL